MLVKKLIEILEKQDQNAHILVNGYEYGYVYLRMKNIKTDKFNYIVNDIGSHGGLIEPNSEGNSNCVILEREE